jgi:hypothetical protein
LLEVPKVTRVGVQRYGMRSGGLFSVPPRPSFCRTCGSSTPWVVDERKLVLIPAGLLDDDPGVKPALDMFVGSKASWWDITDAAPQFEEWVPGYGPDVED